MKAAFIVHEEWRGQVIALYIPTYYLTSMILWKRTRVPFHRIILVRCTIDTPHQLLGVNGWHKVLSKSVAWAWHGHGMGMAWHGHGHGHGMGMGMGTLHLGMNSPRRRGNGGVRRKRFLYCQYNLYECQSHNTLATHLLRKAKSHHDLKNWKLTFLVFPKSKIY